MKSLLGRQEVRAGEEAETEEVQTDRKIGEGQARAHHRITQVVDELQILETEAVGESAPAGKIGADHVRAGVVLVLKGLIADRAAGGQRQAVEIAEAIEQPHVFEKIEIDPPDVIGLAKGRPGVAGIRDVERWRRNDRRQQVLVGVLRIQKEENFIFQITGPPKFPPS